MIDSQVLVCNAMGYRVICMPKLKTTSNQEPNLTTEKKRELKIGNSDLLLLRTFYHMSFISMVSESSYTNITCRKEGKMRIINIKLEVIKNLAMDPKIYKENPLPDEIRKA